MPLTITPEIHPARTHNRFRSYGLPSKSPESNSFNDLLKRSCKVALREDERFDDDYKGLEKAVNSALAAWKASGGREVYKPGKSGSPGQDTLQPISGWWLYLAKKQNKRDPRAIFGKKTERMQA